MARTVLLHDELERARRLPGAGAARRLGGDVETPLAIVFGEPAVAAQVVVGARTLGHGSALRRVVAVEVGLQRDVAALARAELERLEARRDRFRAAGLARDDDAAALGRGPGAERCGLYRGRGHGPLEQPPAGKRVHVSIVPGGRSAGLSARPRDEPPHVALGPARAGLDAEA